MGLPLARDVDLNKGLGTVVADEHIFLIQALTIREGLLHIDASAPGPWRYPGGPMEYSVHGPDGSLFITAQHIVMPSFKVNEHSFVHSDFTLSMEDKVGHAV